MNSCLSAQYRKTTQKLLPRQPSATESTSYDLYPTFPVAPDVIGRGFDKIAERIIGHRKVRIDGYVGVFWNHFRQALEQAFTDKGITTTWVDVSEAYRDPDAIAALTEPYLGGDDPLFGKRCDRQLADFFDTDRLESIRPAESVDCTILFGCGAGLVEWDGPLVYVDLPKNESAVPLAGRFGTQSGNRLSLLPPSSNTNGSILSTGRFSIATRRN